MWGIIGLGRISARHIEALKSLGEEIVATCDIDPEKKATYINYFDLINDERVDKVAICTPNNLHAVMAIEAMRADCDVVLEKPVAITCDDAHAVEIASRHYNRFVYPVLQVRFNPALQLLKNVIKSGFLGRIYNCSVVIRWNRPQEYFTGWRGSREEDGGCLLTQGIHYLDVMLWMMGKVSGVYAQVEKVAHDIEVEDMVNALFSFENGARGLFEFSVNSFQHNTECSIAIVAEKGNVKIGGQAMNKIELWEVDHFPKPDISEGYAPNVYAGGLYQGSCPNHLEVYKSILGGTAVKLTDAVKTIEIIDLIYKFRRG